MRNAVDHGIEPPLTRMAAGKNPEGLIEMRARQIGGEVEILVRDDGRGMDRTVLIRRAVDRGLVASVQDAASLDLADLICLRSVHYRPSQFLFRPGSGHGRGQGSHSGLARHP